MANETTSHATAPSTGTSPAGNDPTVDIANATAPLATGPFTTTPTPMDGAFPPTEGSNLLTFIAEQIHQLRIERRQLIAEWFLSISMDKYYEMMGVTPEGRKHLESFAEFKWKELNQVMDPNVEVPMSRGTRMLLSASMLNSSSGANRVSMLKQINGESGESTESPVTIRDITSPIQIVEELMPSGKINLHVVLAPLVNGMEYELAKISLHLCNPSETMANGFKVTSTEVETVPTTTNSQ